MEPEIIPSLRNFIQASKAKGASDEVLIALLTRRGWAADDINAALGEYWSELTGVAIPERGGSGESSREAFLYLLAFSTLCCWSTALGSAMFAFIDHWFPDPVSRTNYYFNPRSSVTWQMATLVVAFPIFLFVMRAIVRENSSNPERLQSGVRKWLTYIALLGTAGTMIGDLIWFFNYLLSGEITARFFLKSATVIVICAAIFLYYLRSLRPRERTATAGDPLWNRSFAIASAVSVATVFVIGLTVAGTPGKIREQQADARRVEALQNLARGIKARFDSPGYLGQPAQVPVSLTDLVKESRVQDVQIRDPLSHAAYQYRVILGPIYELCASFSAPSTDEQSSGYGSGFWRHGVGRTCFALDASKLVPN